MQFVHMTNKRSLDNGNIVQINKEGLNIIEAQQIELKKSG